MRTESERVTPGTPDRRSKTLWSVVWAALLVGLFLHVLFGLDTSLLYRGDLVGIPSGSFLVFPVFERGGEFFRPLATLPGGVVEWTGAYLSQWFIFPFVGAILLTGIAVGVFASINTIVSRVAKVRTWVPGLIGVFLLVLLWNRYEFALSDVLSVALALCASALVTGQRRAVVRDVCMVVATLGFYILLGGPAILIAMVCGLHEMLVARRYISGVVWIVLGIISPWLLGMLLMSLPVQTAFLRLTGLTRYGSLPGSPILPLVFWTWVGIYAFPLVAMLGAFAYRAVAGRSDRDPGNVWIIGRQVAGGVLVVLVVVGAWLTLARDSRWALRVHACAVLDDWDGVLREATARGDIPLSPQMTRHINRALYETGQLGSRMFAYPQGSDGLLAQPGTPGVSAEASETFLELGLVNQAEHGGCRLLELWGPRPSTLKLLAMTCIAKGEPDAARVFLRRLQRDVIWDTWATETLAELDVDPNMSSDPQIARIRERCSPSRDYTPTDVRAALPHLLEVNPSNTMAFEYLVGTQLVIKRVGVVTSLLVQYGPAQEYDVLPEHYAEAIAAYSLKTQQKPPTEELTPGPRTMRRAVRSGEIAQSGRSAIGRFAEEMPNSYFRYLWVGDTGVRE